PVNLLRRESPVAQHDARRQSVSGRRNGAEAHDGARRADDALEAGARDLTEVLADLAVDVSHEPALVARLERIAFDEALGQSNDAELEALPLLDGGAGATRHFHAAAADADDDGDIARHRHAVDGGDVDEPRFFGARDDARTDARLLRDRV